MSGLGKKIRSYRRNLGWSENKLAMLSGLSRDYIHSIETGKNNHPRTDRLMKIANALGIDKNELFEAAGYEFSETVQKDGYSQLIDKLKLVTPIALPVYKESVFGGIMNISDQVAEIHLDRETWEGKNLQAFLITKDFLSPDINVGDSVIVDVDLIPAVGNWVMCILDGKTVYGRVKQVNSEGKYHIVNNVAVWKYENCEKCNVIVSISREMYKYPNDY